MSIIELGLKIKQRSSKIKILLPKMARTKGRNQIRQDNVFRQASVFTCAVLNLFGLEGGGASKN